MDSKALPSMAEAARKRAWRGWFRFSFFCTLVVVLAGIRPSTLDIQHEVGLVASLPTGASAGILDTVALTDFQSRCQATGVVRCVGFDSQSKIDPHIMFPAGERVKRGQVVTDMMASGAGSLRFEFPPNSPSDAAGSFQTNFRDDLSVQFGAGEEFFVQWRQRFSPGMNRAFKSADGHPTGWKQVIIGEGDQPNLPRTTSCTELELVLQQDSRYLGPTFYHACGLFKTLEFYDGTQVRLQHQGPPYCYYPDDPQKGCFRYVADEWMTFQVQVRIGRWNTPSSRVRVWAAREGRKSVLIFDSVMSHPEGFILYNNPGSGSGTYPGAKYGKLWLLPYITRKDPKESHLPAYTWYDELVISRSRIADPET